MLRRIVRRNQWDAVGSEIIELIAGIADFVIVCISLTDIADFRAIVRMGAVPTLVAIILGIERAFVAGVSCQA